MTEKGLSPLHAGLAAWFSLRAINEWSKQQFVIRRESWARFMHKSFVDYSTLPQEEYTGVEIVRDDR